jgi:8-oxo-dGTP diphosphatase
VSERGPLIRAGGGVVWRHRGGSAREIEVALVHRPKYDDWSLPKGKLEPGEQAIEAAVREVREELGSHVAVSRRITRICYDLPSGRKEVDFWVMRHRGGDFQATAEIDDARWLTPADARAVMSYDIEREVLDGFTDVPRPESVVVLVRHAKAGKRAEWHGDDIDRPLDPVGHAEAEQLSSFLQNFAPDRLVAANPLRCVQTLEPLSRDLDLEIAVDATFSDDAFAEAPDSTIAAVHALAKPNRVSVVCSQGVTIPSLIEHFAPHVASTRTKKGAAWVLGFVDGALLSADYYADAARRPPVTAS